MPRPIILDAAVLLGRLLMAALFLHEAWVKLTNIGPSMVYMERFGVPGLLLPGAIALELGGGLMLVIGWGSRHAALALAAFCIAAAVLFHNALSDGNQLQHFEKDLAIAGGLLVLFAFGPGRFSLRPG
ncbi:DoxX family protein [Bosea sp. BK604]|uniref:DoxX family protein n=1 Tax=Bosea sp. BK604 TaxID=2512180 RepID=UPI00104CBDC8|nr:DoxX family protein [Bosea sp. BK604]TCR64072.1 putative oxidoreductase [Bosea sp. BK604]